MLQLIYLHWPTQKTRVAGAVFDARKDTDGSRVGTVGIGYYDYLGTRQKNSL